MPRGKVIVRDAGSFKAWINFIRPDVGRPIPTQWSLQGRESVSAIASICSRWGGRRAWLPSRASAGLAVWAGKKGCGLLDILNVDGAADQQFV